MNQASTAVTGDVGWLGLLLIFALGLALVAIGVVRNKAKYKRDQE